MLGSQTITSILSDPPKPSNAKHVKGVFTADRNQKIACRLYYHFSLKGVRYERALTELQREFDLSETRLAQILMMAATTTTLQELKSRKADGKYLQKKYPFYNWY